MSTKTQKTQTDAKRTKTRIFIDWADGYRGPGWYEAGYEIVPATEDDIRAAGDKEIVEYIYSSRI